jgi:leader peptidase (prepilin peptidase) / N-methyltransferase
VRLKERAILLAKYASRSIRATAYAEKDNTGCFNMILTGTIISKTDIASYLVVFAILITASIIDIRERRIPNNLIIAGVFTGLALKLYDTEHGLLDGLMGGMSAGLVLLLIYYITRGGLGLGDVKLFGCIGIYLGLESTVSAMLIAAFLSGLYSLALICIDRNNKKREIPFAPFIMAGTLAAIVF